jgi:hypothetical protein
MCVVAVKYFDGVGFVGAKNRDRNYLPSIQIVQSNRTGVQRLYIDDLKSRYTEGLNEFGLCILSASLSVKSDEKEGDKVDAYQRKRNDPGFMSPDGKTIRDALLLKKPMQAIDLLIDRELSGCTIVFNAEECYLLEGGFTVKKQDATEENPREYNHKVLREKDQVVRTNHGILIPELGYDSNSEDPYFKKSRKSSEIRLKYSSNSVSRNDKPLDMLDAISVSPDKDTFMNPVRTGDPSKGDMVTTGQLMLVPKDRTLHYRPLFSEVQFKYSKLNGPEAKTFFEIISSKKLLGFKELHGIK